VDISEDVRVLHSMGYAQELRRRMSLFSNFAISFSIICILAGGITSFQLGFCAGGGASIGIGWPLACLFSLVVACSMGQIASAYPTAGGLYHWASILGGAAGAGPRPGSTSWASSSSSPRSTSASTRWR
jgi:amino acid transporter